MGLKYQINCRQAERITDTAIIIARERYISYADYPGKPSYFEIFVQHIEKVPDKVLEELGLKEKKEEPKPKPKKSVVDSPFFSKNYFKSKSCVTSNVFLDLKRIQQEELKRRIISSLRCHNNNYYQIVKIDNPYLIQNNFFCTHGLEWALDQAVARL
ncbi:MAG: hypothetical protein SO182_02140 [Paludibacteraceae bacterium]|nr:hypothetical protein [Bacteroidales bacterium]MCI7430039.1 hypothetical protein [Bacteroidales bacterium]MDY4850026.1 hypothetical protein [Paludibacteraceae bacterium]